MIVELLTARELHTLSELRERLFRTWWCSNLILIHMCTELPYVGNEYHFIGAEHDKQSDERKIIKVILDADSILASDSKWFDQ